MSRLKALAGKQDTMQVGEFTINLKSISFDKLVEFSTMAEKNDKDSSKLLKDIVFTTLRNTVPTRIENPEEGFNDEEVQVEVDEMDTQIALEIFKRVMELSGLGEDSKTKKV